jgi:GrpB-like predicted nucleotidyltransferase (UPF0157 family)/GNAT superfamily N-acetyltransferase
MQTVRTIIVTDYDPAWPETFEALKARLWPGLEGIAVAVEHVGSTAVPGLAAKPIIDMSVIVPSPADVAAGIAALATVGYVHRGDLGVTGREAFYAPPDLPAHHLYLCPADSQSLRNHLTLRDYLRSHPQEAARYAALKKDLAQRFPHDIDSYINGKTALILSFLHAAGMAPAELEEISGINRKPLIAIQPEAPDTPEAQALIAELTAEMAPLYAPENTYGYSVEKLIRQGVAFFVIRWDGEAVGCGGVQIFDGYAELKRMYVRPHFRGRGLSAQLLAKLAHHARGQGITILRLETGVHQHAAIRFYEREGFYPIPVFGDYQPSDENVFYEKRLEL